MGFGMGHFVKDHMTVERGVANGPNILWQPPDLKS